MVPINYYLILSVFMFTAGALGVVIRKNAIVMLICIELMLNGVNLSFVAFSAVHNSLTGHVAVFFSMVIAAAESGVGLAIIISLFRHLRSTDSSEARFLKG